MVLLQVRGTVVLVAGAQMSMFGAVMVSESEGGLSPWEFHEAPFRFQVVFATAQLTIVAVLELYHPRKVLKTTD